jgi:tetratricopeptide (TPR) repeat protein
VIGSVALLGNLPWMATKSSQGATSEAEKLLAFGREKLREGNLEEAYGIFQSALQIKPEYAEAYGLIGQTFYAARDFGTAAQYLRRAVALNPPKKDLYLNNLGILYAQQGQLDTALVMFQRALTVGIREAEVYRNIGLLLASRGDTAEALGAFRAAVDHRPNVRSMYLEMMRTAAAEFQPNEEGQEQYRKLQAALERGVTEADLDRFDRESFAAMLRASKASAQYFLDLADHQQRFGDLEGARRTLAEALAWNPDHLEFNLRAAGVLLQLGRLEEARAAAEAASRLDPRSDPARQMLNQVNGALAGR